MKIGSRRFRNTVLAVACLLLACAGGEAKQQDKASNGDDADPVYHQRDVDEQAIVRDKSNYDSWPRGYGCNKSQGRVRLRAVLRKSGKVSDVEVREKSGCDSFDEEAIRDAKKRKFTPAKKGGVAVSQYVAFEYRYRID